MDLSISPDLHAFCCYGVVLICALIAARLQVWRRLSENKIYGIWLEPSTWIMFGIYLGMPLVLFWLMDRLGALHDTSLFAALLVGSAYPAILGGGIGGLKAPDGFIGIWKPIEGFTDALVKHVLEQSSRRDKRFEDYIVGRMLADAKTFGEILKFVNGRATGVADLGKDLEALDSQVKANSMDLAFASEKKARIIFLYLSSIAEYQSLLRQKKILTGQKWYKFPTTRYMWKAPLYRNRIVSTAVTIILAVGIVAVAIAAFRWTPLEIAYYQWRLAKPNNSDSDRFRAHEHMRRYVQSTDPETVTRARQSLALSLRSPGMKADSVDLALRLLLESRTGAASDNELADLLIPALRVESVDSRSRIHQVLVLMAGEHDASFEKSELATWNPLKDGDSVASLEKWIRLWHLQWHPEPRPATSQPHSASRPN